jgi:hypothetical protein
MHSEVKVDVTGDPRIIYQYHNCDWTTEIDCEDGDEECKGKGVVKGPKFNNMRVSADKRNITINLRAAGNNPCFHGSPDIDYEGEVTITLNPSKDSASVDFKGRVDEFPYFEMYATVNDGAGKQIFTKEPDKGKTPGNLFGEADRAVSGSVNLSCQEAAPR